MNLCQYLFQFNVEILFNLITSILLSYMVSLFQGALGHRQQKCLQGIGMGAPR